MLEGPGSDAQVVADLTLADNDIWQSCTDPQENVIYCSAYPRSGTILMILQHHGHPHYEFRREEA